MSQPERASTVQERTFPPRKAVVPQELMLFVQSIKGAPASVLLALGFAGGFLSHKELQVWTRCGHSQVTMALKSLQTLGWVRGRTSRGPWRLAEGHQLPVRLFLSEASALKALNDDDDSLNPPDEETTSLRARSEHLRSVLDDCGVEEPTASELAQLPHVNKEYIQAHVQAARAKGLSVGAAIQRMRMGAPAPAMPSARNRQAEVAEKIRRFMEGA